MKNLTEIIKERDWSKITKALALGIMCYGAGDVFGTWSKTLKIEDHKTESIVVNFVGYVGKTLEIIQGIGLGYFLFIQKYDKNREKTQVS